MVSELAIEEIEALEREGVRVSPRDVVRLNAFGLKLEYRADLEDWCACRRAAIVGSFAVREPTLAHEAWMANVWRFFNRRDAVTFMAVTAYCLTRDADALPPWDDVERVRGEIEDFMRRVGGVATTRGLMAAITFVTYGNDTANGEREPETAEKRTEAERVDDGTPTAAVAGYLRNGRVVGLPIPLTDALKMTRGEYLQAMDAHRKSEDLRMGVYGADADEKNAAAAKFYAVLDEIREKAKAAAHGE